MLNYFRCTREKALARELAKRLAKDIPAKFMQDAGKQLSVNKITRSLEKTYQFAQVELAENKKIGLYKRSVMANTFKWELKELGYPKNFIDVATEGLIVELMKFNKNPTL